MYYAIKANRQYKITEDEKQKFVDQGYKIAKLVKGKLVQEEVGKEESKEVAKLKADYEKLKSEHDELRKELEELKGEGK